MGKLKHDLATVQGLLAGPSDAPLSEWLYAGAGSIADFSDREAASAIEAAARMQRPDRVAAAEAEASSKAVRKAARAAAHRLRSQGVTVPDTAARTQWSMGEETVEVPPPVTLLGMPDPDGWIPFVVVSFGKTDTVAFAGLAGAHQGHRDCHHNHIGRSDARKLVHDARRGHDLHELPPHVAIHFLDRAFEEGGARPHEWEHFADLVGAGVVTSARVLDPLRGLDDTVDPAKLADVAPLLDRRHQLLFGVPEQQGQAAVAELVGALGSALEKDDASRTRRIKGILDDAADASLTEEARRAWTLAFDLVTVTAGDRGEAPLRQAARQTALALRAGKAGRDIPFVRASVERQLSAVVEAWQRQMAKVGDGAEAGPEAPEPA